MNLVEKLRDFNVFASLKDSELAILSHCAKVENVAEGSYLAREGQAADHCYAVISGRLVIEIHLPQRPPVAILTVERGEVAGWSWIFPPYQWSADIRALDNVTLLSLDGRCLRAQCEANPALGYALMKQFASLVSQRLQATRLQLMDVYGPRSPQQGQGAFDATS